jgi:hypothetical protein
VKAATIDIYTPVDYSVWLKDRNTHTFKWRKPHIGDTLRYKNLQFQSLILFSYDQRSSSALIGRLAGCPYPFKLASRHLVECWDQKSSILQFHSKITGFGIYDHIASQTAPSSNALDNYCCRRTRHTTDSYPNFFHIAEHNSQHVF